MERGFLDNDVQEEEVDSLCRLQRQSGIVVLVVAVILLVIAYATG